MLKTQLSLSLLAATLLSAGHANAQEVTERTWTRANDTRRIDFPATAAGDLVLPVDTHTHTAFSDGTVWPSFRVWEAEQDNLAAYAVTDHLEYNPLKPDLVAGDHNRIFAIASQEAARIKSKVRIINGAEITRSVPWGHFNALFLTDANALPVDPTMKLDPTPVLRAAKAQGAFLIWNHPWVLPGLEPGATEVMPPEQRALLSSGLVDAVEVANSSQYSAPAFEMALKHNLTIIGASDVHHAIDTDSQIPEGQHRTVTLVLARDDAPSSIRAALFGKRTAVLYRQALYGRERELSEIVGASVRMTSKKRGSSFLTKGIVQVEIENGASIPFQLRFTSASPLTSPRSVTLAPHGKIALTFADVADIAGFAPKVEVLNAFIDPGHQLSMTLR